MNNKYMPYYILMFFLLLNLSCVKYYSSHFTEEHIYSFPKDWKRHMADSQRIFINTVKELEIRFNKNRWCGALYVFPFFSSNGNYEVNICARTSYTNGRIILYGFKEKCDNMILFDKKIEPSSEFQEISFAVRMPKDDYNIVLFFTKYDQRVRGGRFFIKSVKINYKIFNSLKDKRKNINVNCSQLPHFVRIKFKRIVYKYQNVFKNEV
ncbi:MAG: hypothetical protein JW864_18830 [Spirochaetes bacterium]|nr:hypothetical protein [Spirochaetota bacterium]